MVPVAEVKFKSVMVDEAVERKPFNRPMVVEVATPYEVGVNGKVDSGQLVSQVSPEKQMVSKVASVPVAEVKVRDEKFPVPDTVASVSVGLMNVWFSVMFWTMRDLLSESASDWRVMEGWSSEALKFRA